MYEIIKLLHLVGASIWLGGMILMGAFVPVVKPLDSSGGVIKALANRFGQIGWYAYFLSIGTGLSMFLYAWSLSSLNIYFHIKMTLLVITGVLTFLHTRLSSLKPAQKGMMQGLILISTLGIFYTAVMCSS